METCLNSDACYSPSYSNVNPSWTQWEYVVCNYGNVLSVLLNDSRFKILIADPATIFAVIQVSCPIWLVVWLHWG